MKKFLVTLGVSFLFIGTSMADTNKPIVIRVSHVVKEEAPKGLATEEFKRLMEARFPGRVKVELYPDNKLFKDREEAEALELGAVDVIIPASGKVAGLYNIKEFELFDLPFLFNSAQDVTNFTTSPTGKKLLDFINNKSKTVMAVTYWPNNFQDFFGSKFFKSPNDFKGMVAGSTVAGTRKLFLDSLGSKETILLAFSDVPNAMKKIGEYKLDVSENVISNYYTSKIYEGAKYLTISNHNFNSYIFLTNKRWFNSLPEDIRVGFLEIATQAGLKHFEIAQKAGISDLEASKAKGVQVYTLTEQERFAFKKKAIAAHENYLKNINKDYLNEVYKVVR